MTVALLDGKVAIVTGAADGMGRAIVERFAAEGAKVVATDVDAARLVAAHDGNPSVATIGVDITAVDAPDRIVGLAIDRFGRLDILVNAAGIFAVSPLDDMARADWDRMMDVNLNAPFRLCQRALPELKSAGAGRIVNIASTSAHRARAGTGCYTISKHALAGLTISLAVEFAKFGITANSIDPGTILTGITRAHLENTTRMKDLTNQGLMDRLGTVEEIAEAAMYFVGPNSGYTTGHALAVDGGFLIRYPERPA